VLKGRKKSIDFGREAQLYYALSGASNGIRGSLSEDMVKYHRAKYSPLNSDNFKYYDYEQTQTIKEGDRNIIVIEAVPKPKARKAIMRMKIFLDEESLAIIRFNFELSDQGVRLVQRKDNGLAYAIMSRIVHATRDYDKFHYTVQYRQHNNKWYLDRITRHWEILVNSKKRNWKDKVWKLDMDLVMTDLRTDNIKPITEGDIGNSTAAVYSFIGNDFDESFWENYNVLMPEHADSIRRGDIDVPEKDTTKTSNAVASNRQNGFTRADTLRGKLTPLRMCYDVTFYHLDVAIDLDNKSLQGNNLIRFKTVEPFTKMQVDLYANMNIQRIEHRGKALSYSREFNAVFIDFPHGFKSGEEGEIKIFYEGVPQVPDFNIPMHGGVLWDRDSLGNVWAQVVCQGSGASLWWPNKDHQSDEPDSMKIWITVPSAYTDVSNGRLVRKTAMPGEKTRYEWYVSYPINNYNVTFSVGKYTHFSDAYITDDTLTIDYYVMPYNLAKAKKMFLQVKPMLRTFEKYFGKYPFKRDGFALVESLYPMEHQSGVCIGKITTENNETNPLLWHESAHEWWGNSITCKDIADMWIHEAFATYAEVLIVEDWLGKEHARQTIQDQTDAVIGAEPVTGIYDVNHIHYDIGDMYSKGSLMIHTFRNVLDNDPAFFKLVRDIQQHFQYQTLSADELITFINKQLQHDYGYFFDQYLHYTDLPRLEVGLEEKGPHLELKYRWQADVKDFRMPVKVKGASSKFQLIYPESGWKTLTMKNTSAEQFEVNEDDFYIDVEFQ
jgi:hypothetical protein